MTSTNEPKPTKKRTGRKRLPPLAPGPTLQFLVASHPDDFKADNTMRNVRSHVMYKHRGEHYGIRRSHSASYRSKSTEIEAKARAFTRTPSPRAAESGGRSVESGLFAPPSSGGKSAAWDTEFHDMLSQTTSANPLRNLATRIIAAITVEQARSTPPVFGHVSEYPFPRRNSWENDSLEDVKTLYIQNNESCHHDEPWMRFVCSTRMSFLGNLTATCVFIDLADGLLDDSPITVYAKTKLLSMIKESLLEAETSTSDFTVLSILHLLASEICGSGEDVFDAHMEGLVRIIHRRGGLKYLGAEGRIAAFLAVYMLTFTILRSQSEPSLLHDFVPELLQPPAVLKKPPISPLFAPNGDLSVLYSSCSDGCYQILCDMHELTNTFIHRWTYTTERYPQSSLELASYDLHMQQIYSRLLLRPPTDPHTDPDWTYESCRLAALIYCRSIVQGVPLSDSAGVMHASSRDDPGAPSGVTLLSALHQALGCTDTNSDWGDLYGVCLWVCLVGGAASWHSCAQPADAAGYASQRHEDEDRAAAWARKRFALFSVKSSLACGFHQASAMLEMQRRMLRVQRLIAVKGGIASQ
ncbi:uncharacterized protein EI97DRAFT_440451 [Westerdykella ornata]|uniref:Tachykinin family protein n=1 Tax=Westerdykella ornata TaxID=318751 RepID=A0A6A6JRS8_WESOR|nr:uncharacterized protein EI97DRAFT_440451 [Westerdykella ornata]KAF2278955.1 hypothetical protein EI97DRAFT_440451 [Westerdykella ornata]